MKRMNMICIGLLTAALEMATFAQMPELKIQGADEPPSAVKLKSLEMDVEIFGNVATTTATMVFHNSTSRVLEGELTFPLPEGTTVSRYAIDVNGKLRDGVPVPKTKATEVFESIEHRRNIDPGLLERLEGSNTFRTRVYPLPAGGQRTVQVAYEQAMAMTSNEQALQYHLPLDFREPVPEFSLRIKVWQSSRKPQLVELPDHQLAFSGNESLYEASIHKTDYRPDKALTVLLPKDTNVPETLLQPNTDGSAYFLINAYPSADDRPRAWSNRIGIIWDNSLSGLQRDRAKELELLGRIIEQKQNLTVELGVLNIRFEKMKSFAIRNGDWSALKACLQNLVYDGATDFSQIHTRGFSADEYLLFSDGQSTFGDPTIPIDRPVHCITSSNRAGFSLLKAVCAKTGGKFINLATHSVDEAFRQITLNSLQFLGIAEHRLVSEVYPSTPVETSRHLSVTGILHASSGELTLLFGHNGKVECRQKVNLQAQSTNVRVNRLWAQQKIAEMDMQYEQNQDQIELLGRQFGIVTRNTSLLVLETLNDYVRYDVTPPAELMDAYTRLSKEQQMQREKRVANLMERAIAKTEELKTWWQTDLKPEKHFPVPKDQAAAPVTNTVVEAEEVVVVADAEPAIRTMEERKRAGMAMTNIERSEASTSSSLHRQPATSTAAPTTTPTATPPALVRLPRIRSDEDYLQRIAGAPDPYAAYLSLRDSFMGTPRFFFDVAELFYETKQNATGLLILSSLAELELESAELFKTLAYKLKEKGEYARELYIARKIREWRPMDPQSHRDYALALQDNGLCREALQALYGILQASYSPETAARNSGIEEVLVCEINNLLALHGNKLKRDTIDSRLIASLPVDIRVVINWNKDDTDIDLHVTDPNGETCAYDHTQTAIGGRISADFRQGFGPEQFLLKRAIEGVYRIETNFFGERQLTLSGPTTLMAEIYLYYSDGRQERKIITLHQQSGEKKGKKTFVLIGEFVFSKN
jgi:hypothetical protein